MNNILLITTMYPDPFRPGTEVCHFYTKEWVNMGYNVIVINLRSMFPAIYTTAAKLFPTLAHQYVGNHVEMDRNMNTIEHELDKVKVYSIPIFKYIPHGKYPKHSILNTVSIIEQCIKGRNFIPDVIAGHFYNPSMEIIFELKKIYPAIKSSIVFHEIYPIVVKKNYAKNIAEIMESFNIVGFRNKAMSERYEKMFGQFEKKFICYSGTNSTYIDKPLNQNKIISDVPLSKFLFVGQLTYNKSVISIIKALHSVYKNKKFILTCIGSEGTAFPEIKAYIKKEAIETNVAFMEHIDREDLLNYYDEYECFIMISKTEAFGLVYLEAMARGCIVIGTRGQGIDGVIVHGNNGFLCAGGDEEELSQIIEHINNLSLTEKQQIAYNARKTAEEYSDYNVAKKYIESVINA